MPETLTDIEQHSEEVQDIMGRIPGSLIRWGLSVIFGVVLMVVLGSYFFKFKEVVSAPIIITSSNPPVSIISKATGRIAKWYVVDGQSVKVGDPVVLLKNPAEIEDVLALERLLLQLDNRNAAFVDESQGGTKYRGKLSELMFSENLVLGELQDVFAQFNNNWKNYREYHIGNHLPRKIALVQQEMEKQKQYYELALEQQKMMQQELALTEKKIDRNTSLLDKGGISESQMDDAQSGLLQAKRSYTSFEASLKSTEINIISQQRNLLEMQEQHHNNLLQYEQSVTNTLNSLQNQIKNWKEAYCPVSPIDGKVTFTRFWSENHMASMGERLATIVPDKPEAIICRANVSSVGIGKVETEQKVNIKLTGFPYMEYGLLMGKVRSISLVPEGDQYIVEIGVDDNMQSTYREQLRLVQEMSGTADIITKETRLLTRFITPLKMLKK